MPTTTIDAGTIRYDVTGPADGRPVVFLHGYAMASSLWAPLGERLGARGLRCFAPTWPLGAHAEPLRPGADRTLPGVAAMVDAFLAALDLEDVVLVGNDTGGLVAQLVAVGHPDRLGALVLTSCDAFEHFPPPVLKPFILAARTRLTFRAALQPLRSGAARRRAFGALAHTALDDLTAAWVKPALADAAVAEDLRVLTASMRQETSLDAAARLGGFTRPTLVAWSADDAFFPVEDGRRLAAILPCAQLHVIDGARTFSMLDQPDRLAELIVETAGVAA
ncbi:MAG: alpha/beta hydrolase [Pseudonocardia sp.]|nr:alpha/beta hydrolase [Pseudonocardia sp.]